MLDVKYSKLDPMTIGERILAARLAKDITQEALAKRAGISKSAVSQIELGKTKNPKPDNLFLICDALGLDPRAVVFGKESKPQRTDLPPDQKALLDYYTRMSPEDQKKFLGHAYVVRLLGSNEGKEASHQRFNRKAMEEVRARKEASKANPG